MAIYRSRKIGSIACLTLATVLALPAATSYAAPTAPTPSAKDAQKKLDALNKQVEQNVQQYDQNQVDLSTAKKKLDVSKKAADSEQATYQELRLQVARLAASAYKTHSLNEVSAFLSSNDPQRLLDQVAVFSQLSRDRSSAASLLLQSAQRLQLDKGSAQHAYDQMQAKQDLLKSQKATLDKQVEEQKKLLRQVGSVTPAGSGGTPKHSSGGSTGGTYNGPASGNARTALSYAYHQLGCPYVYGGTGPCNSGYDCSGLTMQAWAAAGVTIPRTASAQYSGTNHVSAANRQPGDLVFFSGLGHVAMYVGGDTMIEAPHTGLNVRTTSVSNRSDIIGYGRP